MERLKYTITVHWRWVAGLVLLLAFSRLIPHPPNFTPLGAMAILAGATLKDIRLSVFIPLFAMLISDAIIGFHSSVLFVYIAVIGMVALSRYLLKTISAAKLVATVIIASILFFLTTNFGAWLSHDMYPHTASGLWQAYVAGVPFFRNTLLSNLLFTAISFSILISVQRSSFQRV